MKLILPLKQIKEESHICVACLSITYSLVYQSHTHSPNKTFYLSILYLFELLVIDRGFSPQSVSSASEDASDSFSLEFPITHYTINRI